MPAVDRREFNLQGVKVRFPASGDDSFNSRGSRALARA
jgi:hypothetical protein